LLDLKLPLLDNKNRVGSVKGIKMAKKTSEDILGILREELPRLSSQYNVKKIGLFGSYSRNQHHPESDVDIVVEFIKPIGLKFIDLADDLEKILGCPADILTTDGIRGIRNSEIARSIQGSIVYV
jgi:predicted nucleotidyltransferase